MFCFRYRQTWRSICATWVLLDAYQLWGVNVQFRGKEVLRIQDFTAASQEDVAAVHSMGYVKGLERVCPSCDDHSVYTSLGFFSCTLDHEVHVHWVWHLKVSFWLQTFAKYVQYRNRQCRRQKMKGLYSWITQGRLMQHHLYVSRPLYIFVCPQGFVFFELYYEFFVNVTFTKGRAVLENFSMWFGAFRLNAADVVLIFRGFINLHSIVGWYTLELLACRRTMNLWWQLVQA